jgi:hypothetical protein
MYITKCKNFLITDKIKNSCEYVHKFSKYVKIDDAKIQEFVSKNFSTFSVPSWTSCHFNPNDYSLDLTLAFTFVIDSLNFCFWPYERYSTKDFEYSDLVNNLLVTLKNDSEFFSPEKLCELKVEDLKFKIFNNDENFPLLEERTRSLNELGYFIKHKYNSSFTKFLEINEMSCINIVKTIADGVTTYRDETIYKGRQIFIYKRAQILSADLYYMLKELNEPIYLKDASELTMFADYRVPQILLELDILLYHDELLNKINNMQEILPNSHEEIEIRANTIICVEKIKKELNNVFKKNYLSLEVDYVLWNIGEEKRKILKPHHRTLSIFY